MPKQRSRGKTTAGKQKPVPVCFACRNRGWIIADVHDTESNEYTLIERCDACGKFDSDMDARIAATVRPTKPITDRFARIQADLKHIITKLRGSEIPAVCVVEGRLVAALLAVANCEQLDLDCYE
jgi:hypothetical protein